MSKPTGTNVPFPMVFLERWKEREDYSPVTARLKGLRYERAFFLCLGAAVLIVIVFVALHSSRAMTSVDFPLIAAGLGLVMGLTVVAFSAQSLGEQCQAQVDRFERALAALASRLDMRPEQLSQIDLDDAERIALRTLHVIGRCVSAVEPIVGQTEHPARMKLMQLGEDYYDAYLRAGLVPPTGWKFYLRSRP